MRKESKTLLITGATGYLAANFLNYATKQLLLAAYDYVFLLDRNLKLDRLGSKLVSSDTVHKVSIDLGSFNSGSTNLSHLMGEIELNILKRSEIDILHFAYLGNLDSEITALRFLIENLQVSRFIYLSSAAVYGENDSKPLRPSLESDIAKPISEYGLIKLALEEYLSSIIPEDRLLILRLANPFYGEFNAKGVYQFFRKQLLELSQGESFTVTINAEAERQIIRDFLHINKFNDLMAKCLRKNLSGIYNLASSKPVYLEDFAEIVKQDLFEEGLIKETELKKQISFKYLGFKANDIKVSCLSSEKVNS